MSEITWRNATLGEVADLCLGKMLDQNKNRGVPTPYLANVNVRWGEFVLDDLRVMRFEEHERDRYGLKYGDIVMCEGGEPGRCAIWKEQMPGMMIQKALHRIRPKAGLEHRFLYYSFRNIGLLGGFDQYFTGATIKHLPGEQLAKVEVLIPPLPTQRRIAGILSAYDDLIENSQRRIKILEEMARRLYREWFVYFRFPGHEGCRLVQSPLGEIPEGWEVVNFGELYDTGSGGTPSRTHPEYYEDGTVDWVKSQELLDGFVLSTEERITEAALKNSSAKLFPANTVLIALYGATIGKLAILSCPAATNQACCAILPKHLAFGREFAFLSLLLNRERIIGMRLGAAQQNISQVLLRNFECLKPPIELLRLFSDQTAPFFDQTLALQYQMQNLRCTRDLLLPRLLSGQIDVEALPEPALSEP
jgi:type I restriction enzyme S subunit